MMAWAGVGLISTDGLGKAFGLEATNEDKEKLKKALPTIQTIDRS